MQKRYYYLLATNTWKEEISLIILEDWREGKETIVLVIFKTKNKFWVCIVIPSKKICSENKWGNKIKLFCWLFVYCMLTFETHNIQAAIYTQRSHLKFNLHANHSIILCKIFWEQIQIKQSLTKLKNFDSWFGLFLEN